MKFMLLNNFQKSIQNMILPLIKKSNFLRHCLSRLHHKIELMRMISNNSLVQVRYQDSVIRLMIKMTYGQLMKLGKRHCMRGSTRFPEKRNQVRMKKRVFMQSNTKYFSKFFRKTNQYWLTLSIEWVKFLMQFNMSTSSTRI